MSQTSHTGSRIPELSGLELARDELLSGLEANISYVSQGRCEDYADYRFYCGVIKAYEATLGTIREIEERFVDAYNDM